MSWWNWFFGDRESDPVTVAPDLIWLTVDAKFAGIQRRLESGEGASAAAVLLAAHFPETLPRLEAIAAEHPTRARAVLATQLSTALAAAANFDASELVDVVVAERHPLPAVDDALLGFAEGLTCQCTVTRHVSLDDPVVRVLADNWVRDVMRGLGVAEDECIESAMVARRIRQVQVKIGEQATGNSDAASATDWFAKNCPALAK